MVWPRLTKPRRGNFSFPISHPVSQSGSGYVTFRKGKESTELHYTNKQRIARNSLVLYMQLIAELKSLPHKVPSSAECQYVNSVVTYLRESGVTGVCMYSIFFEFLVVNKYLVCWGTKVAGFMRIMVSKAAAH